MEIEHMMLRRAGQFTIFLLIVMAIVFLNSALRQSSPRKRKLGILGTYVACVAFAITSAQSVSWYIEERIKSYNPGDLWWMNSKVPSGYDYLLTEWTRDTGRAMVFITAPILTPAVMAFAYGLIVLHRQFGRRP